MPQIIGVKFKSSTKVYYFSPEGIEFKTDDGAIVETARGVEFGRVVIANREVKETEIVQPLKPVMRKAGIDDQEQFDRNLVDAEKALKTAAEKLPKHNLDLKFIDVEYTFDRKKIIFYFTAPGRVDFREFVRDLGATFKTRIELRQIHERDDFKMKGALAACGRECCCSAHLSEFEKVSIKMAKVQGLSLNPQKISGLCGKLMCCLKYEQECYKEAAKKMPKEGSIVTTCDGEGKVEANDLLRLRCRVKITKDDGVTRNYYDVDEITFDRYIADDNGNNNNDDNDEEIIEEQTAEDEIKTGVITKEKSGQPERQNMPKAPQNKNKFNRNRNFKGRQNKNK